MIDEPVRSYAPHEAAAIVRSVASAGGDLEQCACWLEEGYSLAAVRGTLRGANNAPARAPSPPPASASADPWGDVRSANAERLGLYRQGR
jgi:hypothetical protein